MSKKLMYFDMEWVPMSPNIDHLKTNYPTVYAAFLNRIEKFRKDGKYDDTHTDNYIWEKEASFTAEFSKIICITFGYFGEDGVSKNIKSLYGHNEKKILEDAQKILFNVGNNNMQLCGYAIKRWDMPWLAKRMVINGVKVPYPIDNGTKKPWEITAVDLSEVWSFGCPQEKYTPFEVLAVSMGVPTPKDDISGADVKNVYWINGELERIKDYCEKDVDRTMDLELKLRDYITY